MDNFKLFKMENGEFIITEITETDDEGHMILNYPAVIVPIPPEQAGGQPNQIGFGKFMPFSDHGKDIRLNPNQVMVDSEQAHRRPTLYPSIFCDVRSFLDGNKSLSDRYNL